MKFLVTPLSGLYSKIFIDFSRYRIPQLRETQTELPWCGLLRICGGARTGISRPDCVRRKLLGSSIPVMCVGVHSQNAHKV